MWTECLGLWLHWNLRLVTGLSLTLIRLNCDWTQHWLVSGLWFVLNSRWRQACDMTLTHADVRIVIWPWHMLTSGLWYDIDTCWRQNWAMTLTHADVRIVVWHWHVLTSGLWWGLQKLELQVWIEHKLILTPRRPTGFSVIYLYVYRRTCCSV